MTNVACWGRVSGREARFHGGLSQRLVFHGARGHLCASERIAGQKCPVRTRLWETSKEREIVLLPVLVRANHRPIPVPPQTPRPQAPGTGLSPSSSQALPASQTHLHLLTSLPRSREFPEPARASPLRKRPSRISPTA